MDDDLDNIPYLGALYNKVIKVNLLVNRNYLPIIDNEK